MQNDGRLCTHILRQHDSIIRFFRGLSETRDFPPLLSPLLSTLCCKVAKFRTRQQDNMFLFINFIFSKKLVDNHLQISEYSSEIEGITASWMDLNINPAKRLSDRLDQLEVVFFLVL